MLGNSIDNLQITLLDDLTTTLKVTDCQKVMVLQSEMAKARRTHAAERRHRAPADAGPAENAERLLHIDERKVNHPHAVEGSTPSAATKTN